LAAAPLVDPRPVNPRRGLLGTTRPKPLHFLALLLCFCVL